MKSTLVMSDEARIERTEPVLRDLLSILASCKKMQRVVREYLATPKGGAKHDG